MRVRAHNSSKISSKNNSSSKSSSIYTEEKTQNPFEDLRAEMLARACANLTAAERRAAEAYVSAFWAQVVVKQ